jgi:hypothetical protein
MHAYFPIFFSHEATRGKSQCHIYLQEKKMATLIQYLGINMFMNKRLEHHDETHDKKTSYLFSQVVYVVKCMHIYQFPLVHNQL